MIGKIDRLGVFDERTGEQRVKLANFSKLASNSEIGEFIASLKPDPAFMYLHVIAIGAGEYYGCNKNGDYFPEKSLQAYHHTFEQGAKVFKEHNNKSTSPSYGYVPKSWYNPDMHRVELILAVDKKKAPDIVARVGNGEQLEVSMGCFPEGTQVNMADGTTKNIEDIYRGEFVHSHLGNDKVVTDTMVRDYRGELYTIKVSGIGTDIQATSEHPFWIRRIIPRERDGICPVCGNYYKQLKSHIWQKKDVDHVALNSTWNDSVIKEGWVKASELKEGDFAASPIAREVRTQGNPVFAKLLGYYLAEANLVKYKCEPVGVEWTFSENEQLMVDEVTSCIRTLYNKECKVYHRSKKHTLTVKVSSREVAENLLCHGGELSHSKVLSSDVMNWDPEVQKILINAYINGDGTWNIENKNISWVTVSKNLHSQILELCKRCGIYAHTFVQPAKRVHRIAYYSTINSTQCAKLHATISKIPTNWEFKDTYDAITPSGINCVRPVTKTLSFIEGDYVYRKITSIASTYVEIPVYNISVDGDDSYQVEGIAVKNCKVPHDVCSICGNKASKKSDYCDHINFHLKHVYEDGKQSMMLNIQPTFFDISVVAHRADKIAYVLQKVASYSEGLLDSIAEVYDIDPLEKFSSLKSSSITKTVPADAVIQKMVAGMYQILPDVESLEPDLPIPLLDRLALTHSLPDILTSFLHNMVPMKPREYARIVVVHHGMPLHWYDKILQGIESASHEGEYEQGKYQDDIGELLSKFLPLRSSYGPHVQKRVLIIKEAKLKKAAALEKNSALPYQPDGTMSNSGTYFNPEGWGFVNAAVPQDYRFNQPMFMNELNKHEQSYGTVPVTYSPEEYQRRKYELEHRTPLRKPLNPFAVGLLLASLYAAYRGVNGADKLIHSLKSETSIAKAGLATLALAGALRPKHDLQTIKQASSGLGWGTKHIVMPFVGAHLLAAHYRRKYYSGQDLNNIQKFVAENPDYISLAAPFAMHYAGKKLPKFASESEYIPDHELEDYSENDIEEFTKIADFGDVLADSAVQGIIFGGRGLSGVGSISDMVMDNVMMRHIGKKLSPDPKAALVNNQLSNNQLPNKQQTSRPTQNGAFNNGTFNQASAYRK